MLGCYSDQKQRQGSTWWSLSQTSFPVTSGSQGLDFTQSSFPPQSQPPLCTWVLLLLAGEQVIQRVFGDIPLVLLGRRQDERQGMWAAQGSAGWWELRLFPAPWSWTCPPPPRSGLAMATPGLTLGGVLIQPADLAHEQQVLLTSSELGHGLLACFFCCVPPAPRAATGFSCTKRRTWARSFCFSDSTAPRWLESAKITLWQTARMEVKALSPLPCPAWASWGAQKTRPGGAAQPEGPKFSH